MSQLRLNPKLMVIGDSLAQGCRSLTVNKELCGQSYGARIAEQQKWEFISPDHPKEVLFDLDAEIRDLDFGLGPFLAPVTMGGLMKRFRENLAWWLPNKRTSSQICFDNLGLTGARISDLYERSEASSTKIIQEMLPAGANTPLRKLDIGNLHISLNARHVLNPSKNPDYAEYTPLQWVIERKPKTLIVQIGHNHGFYKAGFEANPSVGLIDGTFKDELKELALRLAALPKEVEKIAFFLLPKVGAVANLQPKMKKKGKEAYHELYEPVLCPKNNVLTGEDLKLVDQETIKINKGTRAELEKAFKAANCLDRLVVIDAYELLDKFDYKNSGDEKCRISVGELSIDNLMPDGIDLPGHAQPGWGRYAPPSGTKLIQGGFQSMDGMHPSGFGYAILASEVMDKLGLKYNRDTLLKDAYDEDKFLSDYPTEFDAITGLLAIIRAGQSKNYHPLPKEKMLPEGEVSIDECLDIIGHSLVRV